MKMVRLLMRVISPQENKEDFFFWPDHIQRGSNEEQGEKVVKKILKVLSFLPNPQQTQNF